MKKKEAPEHYWNMRVLTECGYPNSDERQFFFTEVHYEKGIPTGYAKGRYNYVGNNTKELNWRLNRMKEALKKPVLDADNWPNEYKDNGTN